MVPSAAAGRPGAWATPGWGRRPVAGERARVAAAILQRGSWAWSAWRGHPPVAVRRGGWLGGLRECPELRERIYSMCPTGCRRHQPIPTGSVYRILQLDYDLYVCCVIFVASLHVRLHCRPRPGAEGG